MGSIGSKNPPYFFNSNDIKGDTPFDNQHPVQIPLHKAFKVYNPKVALEHITKFVDYFSVIICYTDEDGKNIFIKGLNILTQSSKIGSIGDPFWNPVTEKEIPSPIDKDWFDEKIMVFQNNSIISNKLRGIDLADKIKSLLRTNF